MYDTALNIHSNLILRVHRMEMRRRMLTRENANHNSQESRTTQACNKVTPCSRIARLSVPSVILTLQVLTI